MQDKDKKEILYIIDQEKGFTGSVISTMVKGEPLVHYTPYTFDEYNQQHDGKLIALSWDEFEPIYNNYELSLQKPYSEITEEYFYEMFEVLPPMRWQDIKGGFMFFCMECHTMSLHSHFISYNKKYYSALRSKFLTDEQLTTNFFNQLNNQPNDQQ